MRKLLILLEWGMAERSPIGSRVAQWLRRRLPAGAAMSLVPGGLARPCRLQPVGRGL